VEDNNALIAQLQKRIKELEVRQSIIVVVHTYPPVSLTASVYHRLNDILFPLKAKVAELEDELENERALRAKVGYF
jgi:hypothetical protein